MDPALWSNLPEDLLERVLAKLLPGTLLKMRSVCRHWDEIICSVRGLRPTALADGLLLSAYVGLPYHLILKWIDPGRAPGTCASSHSTSSRAEATLGTICCPPRAEVVACDGGVLCFSFPYNVQTVVLCNPLTKCWRKLPPLTQPRIPLTWRVAGMSFDKLSGHHVIVCAGFFSVEREQGENRLKATQVYESSSQTWSFTHQPTPVRGGIWSTSANKVVFLGDYLYVLTSAGAGSQNFLQIFSMKKRTWVEITLEGSLDASGTSSLTKLDENLLLVAAEEHMGEQCLGLWRLDITQIEDLWRQSFKRRMFGANVKMLWYRVKRMEFRQLASLTILPLHWQAWACVVHRRKICLLLPSLNCQGRSMTPSLSMIWMLTRGALLSSTSPPPTAIYSPSNRHTLPLYQRSIPMCPE